ncbi:MAG: type II secretion system protein [Burkholderiales bacterium]
MSLPTSRQRGFTMIEMMAVMIVGSVLLGIFAQQGMAWSKHSKGAASIEHMGQVATALGNFMANNEDILNNIADIQKVRDNVTAGREPAWRRLIPRITLAGDAIQQWDGYAFTGNVNDLTTPPAPALVDCPNKDCVTITVKNLQDWGYLPAELADTNPLGFTYTLRIKRIPMAAQPGVPAYSALDAVVVANSPGHLTDNNPYGDPDVIIGMQTAKGVKGFGMSRVTGQVDANYFASKGLTGPAVGAMGVYGFDADQNGNLGWFFDPVQWGFDNMVAALPVIKSAYWSGNKDGVYMRIDHPFVRDDLNMNGNGINNVDKVKFDSTKTINMGDLCDGKDANGNTLPAPNNKDYDGSQAMTKDGQIATCRLVSTLLTGGTMDTSRKRWAKATPGYLTSDDLRGGAMNNVASDPMWIWAGEGFTGIAGQQPQWMRMRMLIRHVDPGQVIQVPDGANYSNHPYTVTDPNGTVAVVFVDEFMTQWLGGGPFAITYPVGDPLTPLNRQGQPALWTQQTTVPIPNTVNTPSDVPLVSNTTTQGYLNWVYEEWLFSASGISRNTYASVPLTLNPGDHTLVPGSATVTVPSCTTTINALGQSSTSCTNNTYPVQGGSVQGRVFTPYHYSTSWQWSAYYSGGPLPNSVDPSKSI